MPSSAVILASLYFIAEPLFTSSGHPVEVQKLEVIYFRILTLGAGRPPTPRMLNVAYDLGIRSIVQSSCILLW